MPAGIRDKVVILGMGCSRFGERWESSPEDLMVEAYSEALLDAGVGPEQLDAAWFSTHMSDVGTGRGGIPTKRNALDLSMRAAIAAAVLELDRDPAIRALIISGDRRAAKGCRGLSHGPL